MQIDWLTVAAQIVNFLVLVWLLQHFLYAPITRAMKRRETRIEERLSDAREKRDEAEAEAERLKEERADLDARREEMLEEAREEAETMRRERQQEIEEEAEEKRAALRARIEKESDEALREIRKRAAASTFAAIRDILRDFAGADLAETAANRFAEHLKGLDDEERARLAEAAQEAREEGAPGRVTSASEVPSATRSKLTRAIHEVVAEGLEVEYDTDPELLLGLRLAVAGQSVEFSAARHLDRLEAEIGDALAGAAAPGPESEKDAA